MLSLACAAVALSLGAAPEKMDQPDKYDVTPIQANLRVVTDGKGHYYAYDVTGKMSGPAFYGDGKSFYLQRIFAGGAQGDTEMSQALWEPRIERGRNGPVEFEMKEGKYTLDCPPRQTVLTEVPAAEAKELLAKATFYQPRWNRMPYKLARDEHGTYYFVDHLRDAKRDFRLYTGPRGAMKLQQMTNIVSDSVGDIFATKTGELRLILNDNKRTVEESGGQRDNKVLKWVAGKKELILTEVPVEENVALIYNDLGPYAGAKLGTPCDDL